MEMKAILQKFFAKYGETGMYKASWRGCYEPQVPATLVQPFEDKGEKESSNQK